MNDRPWMTALEMQFAALRNCHKMIATGVAEDSDQNAIDHDSARLLSAAVPFAWSKDVTNAVWLASKSIPEDAILTTNVVPESVKTAWWWFDSPLPIPMGHGEEIEGCETKSISGLLLHCDYEAQTLLLFDGRQTDVGPSITGVSAFPFGKTLGDIVRGHRIDTYATRSLRALAPSRPSHRALSLLRFILAASVWLDQRILALGSGHIERHRRKQLAREYNAPLTSDVKVVQLRRFESEARAAGADHETIEWSCRWIVNGHWRNQPYAGGERKLIYIMPFVKGPEDKPLKVPTHTVYQVNR